MRNESRKRSLPLLTPFVLVLMAAVSHAATFYVAATGSDANGGTSTQPWRTLQKAADTARAGDVVLVANGTYAGMNITADGTAAARITFRANGTNVLVNSANATNTDNINIEGADYVTVEGFIIEDAPRDGIRAVTATGVKIRNNIVRRSGLTGILCGFTPSIEISGNSSSGSVAEHGIYLANSATTADNPVIRDNECFDNFSSGIQLNGDCRAGGDGVITGALIEKNVVHDNMQKGMSLISMQGATVRNNLVYENGQTGGGAGGIHLADEPDCLNASNNNVVVNNTVYEPRIVGIRISNGSIGNKIFNNMVIASSVARTIIDDGSGNFIDALSNVKLSSVTGVFVAPGSGNYQLTLTSPALNKAAFTYLSTPVPNSDIDGLSRPQGPLPDVGAYERIAIATGVNGAPALVVALEQNVPNPFNPTTRIEYEAQSGAVNLDVFDVAGRHIRQLVHDEPASGRAVVEWDGRDDHGQAVSSGVYFYRLVAGASALTKRMTLLK
jgi:Right handed beta helix region/FlgD Ig-like domain